jgi:DNA-binding MarR family transcriptional regulator
MERQGVAVKISDISDYLNIPRPGVTRTVKEMEEKGYLRKANAAEDGRITYISLTEEGRKLSEQYNENYFAGLAPYLESISEADAKVMIQTIETFYQVMCERRENFEK